MKHPLIILSQLVTFTAAAQPLAVSQALMYGGSNNDNVTCMAVDPEGNIVIGGRFQGAIDLNPGTGTETAVSAGALDAYLVKLGPEGNFIWARRFGGTSADGVNALAIDTDGNIVVTGIITGTVDMDPGPDELMLTAGGLDDMVICKFDPDGQVQWAVASNTTSGNAGYALDLDAEGNILVGGVFYGETDLNGGSATTGFTSNGEGDAYICKYSASGGFTWARRIGGPLRDEITSISAGPDGSVAFAGMVRGTLDLDPGPANVPYTSNGLTDILEGKLDASGGTSWVRASGSTGYDEAYSVDTRADGSVIVAGYFEGSVDFDPSAASTTLTAVSSGIGNSFVRSSGPNGQFHWARAIGGADGAAVYAVRISPEGHIAIAGSFIGSMDINPGAITNTVLSNGSRDPFVAILNGTGELLWWTTFGSTLADEATAIAALGDGELRCAGNFQGAMDLNGTAEPPPLVPLGAQDNFLLWLVPTSASVDEAAMKKGIRVFPNPTAGELFAVWERPGRTPYWITDGSGRIVSSALLIGGLNRIEAGHLAPGIYTLRTMEGSQQLIVH